MSQTGCHQKRNRCQNYYQNGNGNIDGQHQDQRSQNCKDAGHKLCERLQKAIGNDFHIRYGTADQVASGLPVNVAERNMLQMRKEVTPQIPDGMRRQTVGTQGHQPLKQGTDHNCCCEYHSCFSQRREVHLMGCHYAVHRITNQNRHIERKTGSDQCEQKHACQFLAAGLGIR